MARHAITSNPGIERLGEDEWLCSMCKTSFDEVSWDAAGEQCPGCAEMTESQQPILGAL